MSTMWRADGGATATDGLLETALDTTSVVVNRRVVEVHGGVVDHAQLVGIAHPDVAMLETRAFTVAFSRGPGERPEGFVAPGETV